MHTHDNCLLLLHREHVLSDSLALINALRNTKGYLHPVSKLNIIETHAPWLILTGAHAYKIKKPVDRGFLDYTFLK